jgi:hypothetical protein
MRFTSDRKFRPGSFQDPWKAIDLSKSIMVIDSLGFAVCEIHAKTAADIAHSKIIAEVPTLVKALDDARIALSFYRGQMAADVPGKEYPFGKDAENQARVVIDKIKALV